MSSAAHSQTPRGLTGLCNVRCHSTTAVACPGGSPLRPLSCLPNKIPENEKALYFHQFSIWAFFWFIFMLFSVITVTASLPVFFLSAVLQLCCPEQHSSECSAPRSHAENRWKIPAACAHLSPILPCGQGKAVAFSLCEGLASEQSYKTWLPVSALYNSAYILHQSLCGIFPMRKDRYVGKSLKSWTLPLG